MENRPLSLAAGLIILLVMPVAALAEDAGAVDEQQAGWQMRLDRAAALQAEGKSRQADADLFLQQKNTECATRFLINDCLNAAAREHLEVTRETRRLANEGKAIEREVKREQIAEREKQRLEEAPVRAADLESRQAEAVAARRQAEEKIAATRASKEIKAADGERRKAAEAEKQRRKQAEHEARVARKMHEAEARAAQEAEKK